MKIFFRYDDFSSRSPSKLESQLLKVFSSHGIALLIGVVPFVCSGDEMNPEKQDELPLSLEKINLLRTGISVGAVEVGLHGLNHQTIHPTGQRPSEFRGAPLEDQIARLLRGKEALEMALGNKVRFFIPPWNDYDCLTLMALRQCGFEAISTGKRLGEIHPQAQIKYLPITCEIKDCNQPFKKNSQGSVLGILLHPYEFFESGDARAQYNSKDLDELLTRLRGYPNAQIYHFGDLIDSQEDFSHHRYQANWKLRKNRGRLPGPLKSLIPQGLYFPASTAQAIQRWMKVVFICLGAFLIITMYLFLLLAGYFVYNR